MDNKTESSPGTALVTGASSGIGEEYANQLASRGYDLIVVARRKELLNTLAERWRTRGGVRVEVWPADLSKDEDIADIAGRISARDDLTLLVNNAGFGAGGPYARIEWKPQMDMIHVHIAATARLTKAVLPQMLERNRGAIINVSSVAAFSVLAKRTMYNSTKGWINAFSQGIAEELRGTNVRIQAFCPGFTVTGFHGTPDMKNFDRKQIPRFLWTTSEKAVAASLRALKRKKVVFVPGLLNKIMAAAPRTPLIGRPMARLVARKKV